MLPAPYPHGLGRRSSVIPQVALSSHFGRTRGLYDPNVNDRHHQCDRSFSKSPVRRGSRASHAARTATSSATTNTRDRARVTPVYISSGGTNSCGMRGKTSNTASNSLPCDRCTVSAHAVSWRGIASTDTRRTCSDNNYFCFFQVIFSID